MKTKQDNPIQTQQVLKLIKVEPGENMKGFSLKIGSIQGANEISLLCKQLSLLTSWRSSQMGDNILHSAVEKNSSREKKKSFFSTVIPQPALGVVFRKHSARFILNKK